MKSKGIVSLGHFLQELLSRCDHLSFYFNKCFWDRQHSWCSSCLLAHKSEPKQIKWGIFIVWPFDPSAHQHDPTLVSAGGAFGNAKIDGWEECLDVGRWSGWDPRSEICCLGVSRYKFDWGVFGMDNSTVCQYQLSLVWVLHFHETEHIRPDMVVQQEIWLASCWGSNEESLWHFWSRPVAAFVVQETFFSLICHSFSLERLERLEKIIKSSQGFNDALMQSRCSAEICPASWGLDLFRKYARTKGEVWRGGRLKIYDKMPRFSGVNSGWVDGYRLIQVDPYDDYAEMPGLLPFLKRLTFSVVHVDPIEIPYWSCVNMRIHQVTPCPDGIGSRWNVFAPWWLGLWWLHGTTIHQLCDLSIFFWDLDRGLGPRMSMVRSMPDLTYLIDLCWGWSRWLNI